MINDNKRRIIKIYLSKNFEEVAKRKLEIKQAQEHNSKKGNKHKVKMPEELTEVLIPYYIKQVECNAGRLIRYTCCENIEHAARYYKSACNNLIEQLIANREIRKIETFIINN